MTRYRQPERPRLGALAILGRILLAILAAALMVALALAGGYYLWAYQSVADLRPISRDVKIAQKRLHVPIAGKGTIALVVGYDRRAGDGNSPSRSDTIMLVRADPLTNTISMLSFPRDLRVEDRCPGPNARTWVDRINAAYSVCGARGTLETVKQLTGLDINYLITVNFAGFKQIVNKLDGVWIDVDRRYFNDNGGRTYDTYATINLHPGYQKLKGPAALDYVRFRHTDSDLYRLARQQLFVKSLKEQLTHTFLPISVPAVVNAVTRNHNVEIAQGGNKQIDINTVESYAFFAYKLPQGHIFRNSIGELSGYNELYAPQSAIDSAVRDFLNPDVQAPAAATAAALGKKYRPGHRGPRPSEVSILVLNGNGVAGSASTAAAQLQHKGYLIVLPTGTQGANAPNWNYATTQVYFDRRRASSHAAAHNVAQLFPQARVSPLPAALAPNSNGAEVVVVLGHTYHGELVPSRRPTVIKHQAPFVRNDPGATVDLLKPLRRRVPFRLELPTVLERDSQPVSPAGEEPVRLYSIGRHKAVRLTYKTARDLAGYWGIEEMDWDKAPVLQGPNEKRVIKRRTFGLYYSGAHLHMVVLREHGAVYWVVNTLLDSLSNETMLAIARGLQPMRR